MQNSAKMSFGFFPARFLPSYIASSFAARLMDLLENSVSELGQPQNTYMILSTTGDDIHPRQRLKLSPARCCPSRLWVVPHVTRGKRPFSATREIKLILYRELILTRKNCQFSSEIKGNRQRETHEAVLSHRVIHKENDLLSLNLQKRFGLTPRGLNCLQHCAAVSARDRITDDDRDHTGTLEKALIRPAPS